MISAGYKELEHTADIALRVWGEDFFTILRQSAEGMYDLMGVVLNCLSPQKAIIRIEKADREIQLVDFLNELLYLVEDKSTIFTSFVFISDEGGINVQAAGYKLKDIRRIIKAATFHQLKVIEKNTGLETSITFDV